MLGGLHIADSPSSGHIPVLLHEAVRALGLRSDSVCVDATFGRGGHARELLAQLGSTGHLFVCDQDPQAVLSARALAQADPRVTVLHKNFAEITAQDIGQTADGWLMDLGVSSPQLDDPGRGFSFAKDGPLDMRMAADQGQSVAQWLATVDQKVLADVIFRYGEERQSRRVASAIVAAREQTPLVSTTQLADVVATVVRRDGHKHPATRTFQALRIAINRELESLEVGLRIAAELLGTAGRLAVISFHSLEDRIVKQFFASAAKAPPGSRRGLPAAEPFTPTLKLVGKAVFPSAEECMANPRARSAVLRVAEKLPC